MQPISIGRKKHVDEPKLHTDPVCKMLVAEDSATATYEYKDEKYYFCMPGCRDRFAADPERFLRGMQASEESPAVPPVDDCAEYTCPMHPEIVQLGPGACPKCGMALEPMEVSLRDEADPEYLDMQRRFWISACLTFPVFVLAMSEMFPGFHEYV